MKINKKGITRLVIELRTCVIKIPNFTREWAHFLQGLLSNMNEELTWRCAIINGNSEYLCPVIWHSWGGWILIMRKVEMTITYDNYEEFDYSKHIVEFPGDDKPENYGILNGKIVKIDYGQLDCK